MSQAEIVALGSQRGIVVAEALTDAHGQAVFRRHGAVIEAQLWKATGPDVPLVGARVCLLARLEGGLPTDAHALLADDPYWGRRIGPAQFRTGSLAQQIVLGYRLQGRIRQDGEPVAGANVSLEGELHDAVHGPALFWDSLEYNRLIWSDRLETWIEGAVVDAPIRTDAQGRFELIVPCGHGAIYQRATDLRDGCPETAAEPLPRHLHRLQAAYLGRKVELIEGQVAELELLSGALQITATAGALLRVGALDAPGATYTVPSGGTVSLTGLPAGEHSIVQFRRTGGGLWDATYGCPRRLVTIAPGQAAQITMPALEQYSPGADLVAGRVYLRMGLPAAGVDIVAINWERCEVAGTVATTDAEGYWEAQFPPAGFGGDLWIHDPVHGSMPVIGFPYSDVVLGARAYASHLEQWKPEAWRREDRGHKNFQYIPEAIVIQDRGSGQRYGTIEAAYGGWQTEQALMKFSYVEDLEELLVIGTRERSYRIMHGEQVLLEEFTLTAQPFESYDTISGRYRAAGFHPQKKYLLGGKISGTSVLASASHAPQDHISAEYPEALRAGLEFGDHAPYLAIRHHSPQIAQETMAAPAQPQIAPGMECAPTSASSDFPTRTPAECCDSTCRTHDCTPAECATCAVPGGTCRTGRTDLAHAAPASEARSVRHTESGPAQSASAPATLAIADWICPYCGGPAHRDPDSAAYRRGFCIQCADCFGDAGAMDCRTWHLSPTLAPAGGYRMAAELLRTDGTALRRQVQYHWRPELYQESEEFLTQQGLGQPTNAPRWVARHVTEIDDGRGFGRFDAAAEPPFTPGHDTQYFAALPQIERPLGLTQVKIVLPQGYSLPETVELEVDCERADGQIETVPVRLQAGLRGPTEDDPLGDVVLLRPTAKLTAEALPWPYIGSGLYRGVAAVRVVSEPAPDSCRFALVNDNPWLADAAGVAVEPQMRTPTALQLLPESGPGVELFDDAVGRIYLLHCDGSGRLWLTRRDGLAAPWQTPLAVTDSGSDGPPAADKTDAGIMVVYDQHAGSLRRLTSRDDGEKWA